MGRKRIGRVIMDTVFQLSAAAVQRRLERDRRARYPHQRRHQFGNCGGYAGLCSGCYDDERAEMMAWAAKQPRPVTGETVEAYWRRIGGRFLDSWYDVSQSQFSKEPA